jgi:hypothetical protein
MGVRGNKIQGTYKNISRERSPDVVRCIRPKQRHGNYERDSPRRRQIGDNSTERNDKQHTMFLSPAPLPSINQIQQEAAGNKEWEGGYVQRIIGIVRRLRDKNCFAIRCLFQAGELRSLETFQMGQVCELQSGQSG